MLTICSSQSPCTLNCQCDYVQYAPICSENNITYISACHAGCTDKIEYENGTTIFSNCDCIKSLPTSVANVSSSGYATPGACPIDCMPKFVFFFAILCITKFIEGTEVTSNFLLGIRQVSLMERKIGVILFLADASTRRTKRYPLASHPV